MDLFGGHYTVYYKFREHISLQSPQFVSNFSPNIPHLFHFLYSQTSEKFSIFTIFNSFYLLLKPKQFRLSPPHSTAIASVSITKILLIKETSFSSYTIVFVIINPPCLNALFSWLFLIFFFHYLSFSSISASIRNAAFSVYPLNIFTFLISS